jgi:hypothetical protein
MKTSPGEFTIFTAEGVTFLAKGRTLLAALQRASRSQLHGFTVVAVVESASVVTPAPGKLTALIVRISAGPH